MAIRQPPREAVSWNNFWFWLNSQCVQSASSWGCELKYLPAAYRGVKCRQPPREAVSWNVVCDRQISSIQSQPPREAVSWNASLGRTIGSLFVSLLVRLWVEISYDMFESPDRLSASSWGCELKYLVSTYKNKRNLPSASSWGCELKYVSSHNRIRYRTVSLLVRLWVEILE